MAISPKCLYRCFQGHGDGGGALGLGLQICVRLVEEAASPGEAGHEEGQVGEEGAGGPLQHGHVLEAAVVPQSIGALTVGGMAWQRVLRCWEAVFQLDDPTLLCGTKGECRGRGSNAVMARGQQQRQDRWRWGTSWSRAIGPDSYLRCQYRCHSFMVLTLGGEQGSRVWQSCRCNNADTCGVG